MSIFSALQMRLVKAHYKDKRRRNGESLRRLLLTAFQLLLKDAVTLAAP